MPPAYYDSFANEMMGKFQRLSKLITHRYSNGAYHEEIIRSVLRNFLSSRYSVKTGFIYKDDEHVSKQIDILVIDENVPTAYIFQEGDFAVVRPGAVIAVIEVKTTLSSKDFGDALLNIASAKELVEYPSDLAGIIFGYQRDTDAAPRPSTISKWFQRQEAKDVGNSGFKLGPDLITLFKHDYSLMRLALETKTINDSELYYRFGYDPNAEAGTSKYGWQLSLMLAFLIGVCERRQFQQTKILSSASEASKLVSSLQIGAYDDTAFKLGDGAVSPPVV